MITYKEIIRKYSSLLKEVTHIPQKEVEILLLYLLEKNIIWLHLNYNKECLVEKKLEELVRKRASDYPLEYIIKKASFYGESFIIYEGILIPRPQTEILVEKAIEQLKDIQNPNIIEVGTGSGVISVILALLVPGIKIIAVDINDKALELAASNAKKFNVSDKITFVKSDLFTQVEVESFDMCISNPPYIQNDYKLPKNVACEPLNALFGGENGNEILIDIIEVTHKNKIKFLFCEMGFDQKNSLNAHLKKFKLKHLEFFKDYEKFDRGFTLEFNY
jgi:release factor glutamine methyltransferase